MFFRATQANDGAGLGLYIVKEAIDKLKGEITIDSEVGKGTTFKITIPNHYATQLATQFEKQLAVEDVNR